MVTITTTRFWEFDECVTKFLTGLYSACKMSTQKTLEDIKIFCHSEGSQSRTQELLIEGNLSQQIEGASHSFSEEKAMGINTLMLSSQIYNVWS